MFRGVTKRDSVCHTGKRKRMMDALAVWEKGRRIARGQLHHYYIHFLILHWPRLTVTSPPFPSLYLSVSPTSPLSRSRRSAFWATPISCRR